MSSCHLLRGICAAHHSKCTEKQLRAKILTLFPHLEHTTVAAGDVPELDCTRAINGDGGVVHLGDESRPDFVAPNLFIPDGNSPLLNLGRDTCKKFHKCTGLQGKLTQYKAKYSYEKAAAMPEAERRLHCWGRCPCDPDDFGELYGPTAANAQDRELAKNFQTVGIKRVKCFVPDPAVEGAVLKNLIPTHAKAPQHPQVINLECDELEQYIDGECLLSGKFSFSDRMARKYGKKSYKSPIPPMVTKTRSLRTEERLRQKLAAANQANGKLKRQNRALSKKCGTWQADWDDQQQILLDGSKKIWENRVHSKRTYTTEVTLLTKTTPLENQKQDAPLREWKGPPKTFNITTAQALQAVKNQTMKVNDLKVGRDFAPLVRYMERPKAEGGMGLTFQGGQKTKATKLMDLLSVEHRRIKKGRRQRTSSGRISMRMQNVAKLERDFFASDLGKMLRECQTEEMAEKVLKAPDGKKAIYQAKRDGFLNVFVNDEIRAHIEECILRGLVEFGPDGMPLELKYREWTDHGALNGFSTSVTIWTMFAYSPCFKKNMTKEERAFVRKKFIVQVVPSRPTKQQHDNNGARRLALIKQQLEPMTLKAPLMYKNPTLKIRLKLFVSDTKAADHELGKISGGNKRCFQCHCHKDAFGSYADSCDCMERSLLEAVDAWLNAQEPGMMDQQRTVDGYSHLPALLSALTRAELREFLETKGASMALEEAEFGCEAMHTIMGTGKDTACLLRDGAKGRPQMSVEERGIFDANVRALVNKEGIKEASESRIRDFYSIWPLVFAGCGLSPKHEELVVCFTDMYVLVYQTDTCPRDCLHLYASHYKFFRLAHEIFGLDEIEKKEPLRRQWWHAWHHLCEEYRRGSLWETIAQGEEAIFNFLRRVVGLTNRKTDVIFTCMKKYYQQKAQDIEMCKKTKVLGQSENSWIRLWMQTNRKQEDVLIPDRWMWDRHGRAWRARVADFDFAEWADEDTATKQWRMKTGEHQLKYRGVRMFSLADSREEMRDAIKARGEAIAQAKANNVAVGADPVGVFQLREIAAQRADEIALEYETPETVVNLERWSEQRAEALRFEDIVPTVDSEPLMSPALRREPEPEPLPEGECAAMRVAAKVSELKDAPRRAHESGRICAEAEWGQLTDLELIMQYITRRKALEHHKDTLAHRMHQIPGKDRKLVKQLTEKAVVAAGKAFGAISDYVVHVRKLDPADKKQWLEAYL